MSDFGEDTGKAYSDVDCDLILSLGTNCAITYNLRSYYGIDVTAPLDWTITPLGSLSNLVRNGFRVLTIDNALELECIKANGADDIVHAPTGVLLHHEFHRLADGRMDQHWRDEIPRVSAKFSFLAARMDGWLNVCSRPALFINGTGFYDGLRGDIVLATHARNVLINIIQSFCDAYPKTDPVFCIIGGHPDSVSAVSMDYRVRKVDNVPNYGEWHEGVVGHYAGCRRGWRQVLDQLRIRYVSGRPAKHGYRVVDR